MPEAHRGDALACLAHSEEHAATAAVCSAFFFFLISRRSHAVGAHSLAERFFCATTQIVGFSECRWNDAGELIRTFFH